MKKSLRETIRVAVAEACRRVTGKEPPRIAVEKPRRRGQGDLSTNAALLLASRERCAPREIAARLVEELRGIGGLCDRIEIAGPGFINVFLAPKALHDQLRLILSEREDYGAVKGAVRGKVQIEFVSANPTGPLTVAHGRQAAVGDSLARILSRAGSDVTREYYLNDTGRQIRLLGLSVWARYREMFGVEAKMPADGYRGDYVRSIAGKVRERDGKKWLSAEEEAAVDFFSGFAVAEIMAMIRTDLEEFRVRFDHWTSEREFAESGAIDDCLRALRERGLVYEKDGATWFRSSDFGDDKDRVLIKGDGDMTYFTPDIAYHREKFRRGFDRVIDLWGPDHHGYVSRMKAAVKALGCDEARFTPLIVQLTTLFRGSRKLSMSTRAGEFVTLRQLLDEVGVDAARYFFARMKVDSHLNFDLELAAKRSNDNPVYYVQYVHARICSMFGKLSEKKPSFALPAWDAIPLDRLKEPEELTLVTELADFPVAVEQAAAALEPNRICNYLESLASSFHRCYTEHRVLSNDDELTAARLALAEGVKVIVKAGLDLLGVEAPERM